MSNQNNSESERPSLSPHDISCLRERLASAGEKEKDLKETTEVMLFLLEEMEETIPNIERAKREWESTFDAVSDFISIHDRDFRIIRANKAFADKFNTTPKELKGKYCYELFHGTMEPIDGCPHKETLQTKENAYLEWDDPTTSTVYDISTYPLFDDKNEVKNIIHVIKDITRLKRAEQELRILNDSLAQTNRQLQETIEKARDEAEISKVILDISREVMGIMEPASILQKVIEISSKIFNSDILMAFLWNKDRESYVQVSAIGAEHILTINPDNFPAIGQALRIKSLTFIEDEQNPLLHQGVIAPLSLKAMSIIPLQVKDQVVGFIIRGFRTPKSFLSKEKTIMEGIGYQLGLALNNAYLYRESIEKTLEISHQMQTIEVMHEIDRSILALCDRIEILKKVSHMLGQLIPCDGIIILLVDNELNGFRYKAGWGIELPLGEIVPFNDINASEVFNYPRISVRTDLSTEGLVPFDRRLYESGFFSDIRVPLFSRDKVVGLLEICSRRIAGFTTSQLTTLEKIASQISVALDNARLVEDLQELIIGITLSLAKAIEAKSPWTKGHSERVTEYALKIGLQMRLNEKELEDLRLAGLLHDIGKIGTYEALLDKPAKLTPEEFEIVKKHPHEAIKILEPVKGIASILPAILHHHENYDGTGYPDGLKGEEIPLFARILSVADAYDSMTADRPYRQSPGKDYAISELRRCSGTQFDPELVESFLKSSDSASSDCLRISHLL